MLESFAAKLFIGFLFVLMQNNPITKYIGIFFIIIGIMQLLIEANII
jgi:hypothetical protein